MPEIVSASYRTDIPAFFTDWLLARLAAGVVRVRNPYGGPPALVRLDRESVAAWVFWTRNPSKLGPVLDRIDQPVAVQMSILDYPRELDPFVPPAAQQIVWFRALAARLGPRAMVWRYDPIVMVGGYDHRTAFAVLARALAGASDEVVVSFAHPYAKTVRNLRGIDWRDPDRREKQDLLIDLQAIAARHGLSLTVCSQPDLLVDGIAGAACIDAGRLQVIAPLKANRPGCLCAAARDIGRYDTCAHGCRYCYANHTPAAGRAGVRDHKAQAEQL